MSLAFVRPCTSGIPSPPDTTTARPAVQCCAVPFPANGLHSALHGEALQHIRNQHSIVLRAAESRRGRRSVDDTLALAARAVGPAGHQGFSVRKRMRSGRAISTLRRGAVAGVAAAPAPLGVCATGRGVAPPPLLLVATIVLLRVKGCEEGSKSALAGFRHAESVLPPRY